MNDSSVPPPLYPKIIAGCGGTHSSRGLPTILSDTDAFAHQSASYGPQQLLACSSAVSCSGEVIFVYDMNSMQLTQSLCGHKAAVSALLWRRPPASHLQTGVFLWSGDTAGVLMYWDVVEGVALTRIQTACHGAVQSLALLTEEHLLVVTADSRSYIFNAHLVDDAPLPPFQLPLEVRQSSLLGNAGRPSHVALCRLSDQHCCAVVLGDRVRIISAIQLEAGAAAPSARDLVYDSNDGVATVIDVVFSDAQEETLYFATRNTVGCYDWKLGLMLNESLLWMPEGVEFRRLFRSYPSGGGRLPSTSRDHDRISQPPEEWPLMYSLGSDQRLVAWHITRRDRFNAVATDVRGVRINSKLCVNVAQSERDPTRFAVLFEDGAIAHWQYDPRALRWRLRSCWLAPVVRPVTCCPVGLHHSCVALESGHLAMMDVTHAVALRRFNVVYSGGTQIVLLCGHKWGDMVWVVSDRVQQQRHHHQVSLIDTRTGEIIRVLRKPSSVPEQTRMKEITMDPTATYVLLTYWNGTFEVWTAEDSRLVHIHSGLGVANVSWAPPSMRRCVSGIQGTPQLLAVFFSEGTLSLWSVYKDRAVVSRDAIPLLQASAAKGVVRSRVVSDGLVTWDSQGNGLVLYAQGTRLAVRRLRDAPPNSGAVLCIAGPPSQGFSMVGPTRVGSPSVSPTASSFANADDGRDELASPRNATVGSSGSLGGDLAVAHLTAVLFESGIFAIWDLASGERRALSSTGMIADLRALSLYWAADSLCVLGLDGCLYILDSNLAEANSSARYRALRRPMQNPSFLLPAHRTLLQAALELGCAREGAPRNESGTPVSPPAISAAPSAVMEAVPLSSRPCRGPFGQLLTEETRTLRDELELYCTTMVPREVLRQLRSCGSTGADGRPASPLVWLRRAAVVSGFFGQSTRQRFMLLAADALSRWVSSILSRSVTATSGSTLSKASSSDEGGLIQDMAHASPSRSVGVSLGGDCIPSAPQAYVCADAYSEALANVTIVRHNRVLLNEQRSAALLVNARNYSTIDDSVARLALARDWLRLAHSQNAIEVLLDTASQSAKYNEMSNLAVAVAASTAVKESSEDSAASALFVASAKRAAAMLLAQGDVDAAVEKLVLAGERRSACVTLQSKGRWREALLLIKAAPHVHSSLLSEVLKRWSALSVQRGFCLAGAALLLAGEEYHVEEDMPAPWSALALLLDSAHFADVAGVLALTLTQFQEAILRWSEAATAASASTASLLSSPGRSPVPPPNLAPLTETVLHGLGGYCSLLHTVGDVTAEAMVLRQAAAFKASMQRTAVGRDTASSPDGFRAE